MTEKTLNIITFIVLIIALIIYSITTVLPEVKKQQGSSDKILSTSKYKNMYEIMVDDKIDFALVTDEKNIIYGIMFFSDATKVLHNKDIENHNFDETTELVIEKLIEEDYLKTTSTITLVRYNDYEYDKFKSSLNKQLTKYHLQPPIELETTIEEKAKQLGLTGSNDSELFRQIDYYSKEVSRETNVNGVVSNNKNDTKKKSENVREYTDNVYKKLEKYVIENKISNQKLGEGTLQITTIPASTNLYPTSNSYYYVENGNIFAYIEIIIDEKATSFCYNGNIDSVKDGVC